MAQLDDTYTYQSDLAYIRTTMKTKLLDRDEEQLLARRWRENKDEKALHQLINAYGRLVVAQAMKFKYYGLPVSDLIQEGQIGLLEAANRFEPDRELRFSTYAMWWIKATMQDYILRNWSIVRTGTTSAQKALFFNFRRLRSKIESQTGGELTDEARHHIAKTLDVKYTEVVAMEQRINGGDHSLSGTIGEEGDTSYQDLLADERSNPEQVVTFMKDRHTRNAWLTKALSGLNEREQHIVTQRTLGNEVVTLEALGQELGISKERVRQLETRALEKLKTALLKQAPSVEELFVDT